MEPFEIRKEKTLHAEFNMQGATECPVMFMHETYHAYYLNEKRKLYEHGSGVTHQRACRTWCMFCEAYGPKSSRVDAPRCLIVVKIKVSDFFARGLFCPGCETIYEKLDVKI